MEYLHRRAEPITLNFFRRSQPPPPPQAHGPLGRARSPISSVLFPFSLPNPTSPTHHTFDRFHAIAGIPTPARTPAAGPRWSQAPWQHALNAPRLREHALHALATVAGEWELTPAGTDSSWARSWDASWFVALAAAERSPSRGGTTASSPASASGIRGGSWTPCCFATAAAAAAAAAAASAATRAAHQHTERSSRTCWPGHPSHASRHGCGGVLVPRNFLLLNGRRLSSKPPPAAGCQNETAAAPR